MHLSDPTHPMRYVYAGWCPDLLEGVEVGAEDCAQEVVLTDEFQETASSDNVADVEDLKLPLPARQLYGVEKLTTSDNEVTACSPVPPGAKSARRVVQERSGPRPLDPLKQVQWSKGHAPWCLVLPSLGHHEIVVEVERANKGIMRRIQRRAFRVLINGRTVLETTKPLSKARINLERHRLDFCDGADGSVELFVDGVPFEKVKAWPTFVDMIEKEKELKRKATHLLI